MVVAIQRNNTRSRIRTSTSVRRRSHSPQDPVVRSRADLHHSLRGHCPAKNRITARKRRNFVTPMNDEFATSLLIEIDTKLLTGDLDRDIEIMNSAA